MKIKTFLVSSVISLMLVNTSYAMQWDISGHPENQYTVSWVDYQAWVLRDRISTMFIVNDGLSSELSPFDVSDDEGEDAISRRWYLTITDLPANALWPNRSVHATFYGQDGTPASVLDGSTFGKISIWEPNPENPDEITLVVDFTKVRSQGHEFGVYVTIMHCNPTRVDC